MSPRDSNRDMRSDDPTLAGNRELTDREKKAWKRETKSHADRKHGGSKRVEEELNGYMGVAKDKKGWWKR